MCSVLTIILGLIAVLIVTAILSWLVLTIEMIDDELDGIEYELSSLDSISNFNLYSSLSLMFAGILPSLILLSFNK